MELVIGLEPSIGGLQITFSIVEGMRIYHMKTLYELVYSN